jgi:hypothetical protein
MDCDIWTSTNVLFKHWWWWLHTLWNLYSNWTPIFALVSIFPKSWLFRCKDEFKKEQWYLGKSCIIDFPDIKNPYNIHFIYSTKALFENKVDHIWTSSTYHKNTTKKCWTMPLCWLKVPALHFWFCLLYFSSDAEAFHC